jgi:hypothetical protein
LGPRVCRARRVLQESVVSQEWTDLLGQLVYRVRKDHKEKLEKKDHREMLVDQVLLDFKA